jgi:ADP-heptose:LPS heptosyltransferase
MRILALVPGGIDAQLFFFPTLETLKKQYPQADIDVLVEPRAKAAYRVCKNVDDVLVFDYQDRNSLADYLNLLGIIRDREYDAAIDVGTPWTIATLIWLNGIPTRIGYKRNSSWYLSNPVTPKSEQYIPQMYHDLVAGLGIITPCPPISINVPTKDISWAETKQQNLNIKDSGYILLYGENKPKIPGNKPYPLESWREIVKGIQAKETGLSLVLLQTANNPEWVTSMMSVGSNLQAIAVSDAGKLAAIIAGANLILCTDSIPLQLAVAVKTFAITLLGGEDSSKRLPPQGDNLVVIQSSSGNIADIKPETVMEKMWQG